MPTSGWSWASPSAARRSTHSAGRQTAPDGVPELARAVRASIYSLSSPAPCVFGADLDRFGVALRALVAEALPDGVFSERLRGITLSIWR
ncbi:MAG TPA: hypothetical protein VGH76_13705 [Actinomycetospora sp.]|uniref:hypothetical protein n=1 Tax=Actinomycetospora sp. TaxID=1872135 RepID=UPI002F3ED8C6